MRKPIRYLSKTEVADRIGVRRDTLNKYALPDPDAYIGDRRGWTAKTIDDWNADRPGRGRWGKREDDAK